jgi:hypothetical protein
MHPANRRLPFSEGIIYRFFDRRSGFKIRLVLFLFLHGRLDHEVALFNKTKALMPVERCFLLEGNES